jgi:hypothetical protein
VLAEIGLRCNRRGSSATESGPGRAFPGRPPSQIGASESVDCRSPPAAPIGNTFRGGEAARSTWHGERDGMGRWAPDVFAKPADLQQHTLKELNMCDNKARKKTRRQRKSQAGRKPIGRGRSDTNPISLHGTRPHAAPSGRNRRNKTTCNHASNPPPCTRIGHKHEHAQNIKTGAEIATDSGASRPKKPIQKAPTNPASPRWGPRLGG